ncbi:response regulator [Pelagibacterium xiamenense]|uniref:response regulator n=1 Tax=Pelagibacterium xiamenense TaxID=2901140 RepID=UPI001E3B1CB1|nr:response regulator [Pelagibacterium xiamenense]MCD7058472.1 response regulator [Pelagibacterium xiamenense]
MASHTDGRAVLVVEDEPLLRLDIAQAFEDAGFTVLEAATVDEALEALGRGIDVDLIFTDIETPGRHNGLDLVEIARAHWPDVPVLVTSGKHRPETPRIAWFFPKPYDATKIVTQARSLAD